MHPSPAPTIISPLGNSTIQFTPSENNFLTGATRLYMALSIYTSNKSPVFVPQ